MSRVERNFKVAIEACKFSIGRYRVGAAIFKGKRLVSIGWNSHKTSPNCRSIFNWHHAETSAICGVKRHLLVGTAIYVVRIDKQGNRKISRPCVNCWKILKVIGVKKVFYIDRDGNPQSERIN